MNWGQVFALVGGNLALILPLWLWNRAESRADNRHMDNQIKTNRDLILEVHKETAALIMGMRDEMKDFHFRLLEIERRKKD